MKLLKRWKLCEIDSWNVNRKLLNQVIDIYNQWQLNNKSAKDVYDVFAINYIELENEPVDFSEDYNIIFEALKGCGFDLSFYHGW